MATVNLVVKTGTSVLRVIDIVTTIAWRTLPLTFRSVIHKMVPALLDVKMTEPMAQCVTSTVPIFVLTVSVTETALARIVNFTFTDQGSYHMYSHVVELENIARELGQCNSTSHPR